MRVITARNVHQALPLGIALLQRCGLPRQSRAGDVLLAPWPVTTEYLQPLERVVFWPQRDANPFFHLYESLWMLAGRNDLAPLLKFVRDFSKFSDDGKTLHGAYGHRWRQTFGRDQLWTIAQRLRENPDDRRCILQMWDPPRDLGGVGKDVPCNTTATLQRNHEGALDLTVFCRSNDIVWGAYGANAVHFGFLLEYMAAWIGCPVGVYRQVSVNWHGYIETLKPVSELPLVALSTIHSMPKMIDDPYVDGRVVSLPLAGDMSVRSESGINRVDADLARLLRAVDTDWVSMPVFESPFFATAAFVLRAHHEWRTRPAPDRFTLARHWLASADQCCDWTVAAQQWIARREEAWERKLVQQAYQPPPHSAAQDTMARERE